MSLLDWPDSDVPVNRQQIVKKKFLRVHTTFLKSKHSPMKLKNNKLKRLTYQVEQTVRLIMRWYGLYCIKVNTKGFLSAEQNNNKTSHMHDLRLIEN